jgi:hypothetical protein
MSTQMTSSRSARHLPTNTATYQLEHQKAGGVAAIYLALALVAAIPYFLLVVDYPSATTAADKVALVVDNYASMYAVYLGTYVLFGIAVGGRRGSCMRSGGSTARCTGSVAAGSCGPRRASAAGARCT